MEPSLVALDQDNYQRPLEQYEYSALQSFDSIRLLVIEPDTQGPELCCSIFQRSLTDEPIYEALSYAWGDPNKTHSIRCGPMYIDVTVNLYSALCCLRYPDRRRTIWVDAICINQENTSEKTQQVQRMMHIYSQAATVLIWLGDEYHTDSRVFQLIDEFNESNKTSLPAIFALTKRLSGDNGTLQYAVARLFQRPWFRRVWVIQEAAVAAKASLICGTQVTDWKALVRMIRFVQENALDTHLSMTVYFGMIISIIEEVRASRASHTAKGPTLLNLLEKTQICSATDPRDRVFALLGIASDATSAGISVDYSLECNEVYERLARHALAIKQSFSVFSFSGCQVQTRVMPGLPSWVPDWSPNANPAPRSSLVGQGFKASGDTTPVISTSLDGNELIIHGYIVDKIHRVGLINMTLELSDPFANSSSVVAQEVKKEMEALEECDDISSITKPTYPTGELLESVYWRILICNRLGSGSVPPPEMASLFAKYQYLMSHYAINQRWHNLDLSMLQLAPQDYQYGVALGKWTSDRVFCATEGRFLGWVPRGAKEGDVICILEGGEVPLVLSQANDGRYQVLGDCYVHGIMDGEAMGREGLKKEEIRIF